MHCPSKILCRTSERQNYWSYPMWVFKQKRDTLGWWTYSSLLIMRYSRLNFIFQESILVGRCVGWKVRFSSWAVCMVCIFWLQAGPELQAWHRPWHRSLSQCKYVHVSSELPIKIIYIDQSGTMPRSILSRSTKGRCAWLPRRPCLVSWSRESFSQTNRATIRQAIHIFSPGFIRLVSTIQSICLL